MVRSKHSTDVSDDNEISERHYLKEAIEKACKKVLEEKLCSEIQSYIRSRKVFRDNNRK